MLEPLKAGTRCECRDAECVACIHGGRHHDCRDDAVRVVTVQGPLPSQYMKDHASNYAYPVAMCAACAEYHERQAK